MGHSVQLGFCLLVMGFDSGLLAYDLPRLQGLSVENLLAGLIDVESIHVEHAVWIAVAVVGVGVVDK